MTVPSKAAKFADAAEAAGWTVERGKGEGGTRTARCSRGTEQVNIEWAPGQRGLNFVGGWHWIDEDPEHAVEITNVAAMLRDMQKPVGKVRHENGKTTRLPFDPINSTDEEIIDAIRGKVISWKRTVDGEISEERVPPFTTDGANPIHVEGKNTKVRTMRWLDFDSATGRRTIDVNNIIGVKR